MQIQHNIDDALWYYYSLFWLPAWWALWLLWWPLTDAVMFQCVYWYLQSVFFFLVLFHFCILLEIKLTTTTITRGQSGPPSWLNTLRPRQNGRRFADDTFKRIFLNEGVRLSINISLKFVPQGPINNNPALVQIMAWRRSGDKPLPEPMLAYHQWGCIELTM